MLHGHQRSALYLFDLSYLKQYFVDFAEGTRADHSKDLVAIVVKPHKRIITLFFSPHTLFTNKQIINSLFFINYIVELERTY